jgi:hypothetical protein
MKPIFAHFVCGLAVAASVVSLGTAQAGVPNPYGSSGTEIFVGQELFASGGDVTVTSLGPTGASYDEHLFLASPANGFGQFFDNHATLGGTTLDLGTFAAGTELEFGVYVNSTGNTWYDGPGSRNADGGVHAYLQNGYTYLNPLTSVLQTGTYVGFEDLYFPNSDFNYADLQYLFQGVAASVNPPTVPDGASTMTLLGMGLGGLMAMARRFKN